MKFLKYFKAIFRLNCPSKTEFIAVIRRDIFEDQQGRFLDEKYFCIRSHIRECKRCGREIERKIAEILLEMPAQYLKTSENPYKIDRKMQSLIRSSFITFLSVCKASG